MHADIIFATAIFMQIFHCNDAFEDPNDRFEGVDVIVVVMEDGHSGSIELRREFVESFNDIFNFGPRCGFAIVCSTALIYWEGDPPIRRKYRRLNRTNPIIGPEELDLAGCHDNEYDRVINVDGALFSLGKISRAEFRRPVLPIIIAGENLKNDLDKTNPHGTYFLNYGAVLFAIEGATSQENVMALAGNGIDPRYIFQIKGDRREMVGVFQNALCRSIDQPLTIANCSVILPPDVCQKTLQYTKSFVGSFARGCLTHLTDRVFCNCTVTSSPSPTTVVVTTSLPTRLATTAAKTGLSTVGIVCIVVAVVFVILVVVAILVYYFVYMRRRSDKVDASKIKSLAGGKSQSSQSATKGVSERQVFAFIPKKSKESKSKESKKSKETISKPPKSTETTSKQFKPKVSISKESVSKVSKEQLQRKIPKLSKDSKETSGSKIGFVQRKKLVVKKEKRKL